MFEDELNHEQFNLASCDGRSVELNLLKGIHGVETETRSVGGVKKLQTKNWCKKKKIRRDDFNDETKKKGHWTYQQNKKYHEFLQIYNKHFLNKQMRRTQKIFKRMQAFLGSRQAQQCRSHHQKMQKKHKNFESILLHLRYYFYGTDNHLSVKQDLANQSINFYDSLLQVQIISKTPQTNANNSPLDQKEQQNQESQSNQQNGSFVSIQEEQSKVVENLLSDKYELHMNFNNLLT